MDINKINLQSVKNHAEVFVLHQLVLEMKLDRLRGEHHWPIIALTIAHLLCKASILKISIWIGRPVINEAVGTDSLSTETLYHVPG